MIPRIESKDGRPALIVDGEPFLKPIRIWNGDRTDWGLKFASALQVLRVSPYTR